MTAHAAWPALPPLAEWQDTLDTVHMWTQVVGKIRLELSPWINHSWGSTLYVTSRGLGTSPVPHDAGTFEMQFDFVAHRLVVTTSRGDERALSLKPMSVAHFYAQTLRMLRDVGVDANIFTRPVEVVEAIPFEQDERHASYDADAVNRFWHALVQVDRVFKTFRANFIGKVSPVHFFWGAFDLAVTRFSGRTAPLHPGGAPNCADWVMQEAYSHELASSGFWPGTGLGEAAFYSYAYPEPDGYRNGRVSPDAAYYSETLREFILPYAAVQAAADPDRTLLEFLQTSYENAADIAKWDRAALERANSARGFH